jgi:hypothetical protein
MDNNLYWVFNAFVVIDLLYYFIMPLFKMAFGGY